MYGIYTNIGGILMVNVTIYSIHGSYGYAGRSSGDSGPSLVVLQEREETPREEFRSGGPQGVQAERP